MSGSREPDSGGDARRARNFRGTPLSSFFIGLRVSGLGFRV
jgi:hypothetical protein